MTDTSNVNPEWESLSPELRTSLSAAWRNDVPPTATALYGRWWQLETWLRSLVYVELRAAFGPAWVEELPDISGKRQELEHTIRHMPTPDSQARLAYADVSALFKIIEKHWSLFEDSLIARTIWMGRAEELLHIRNRIGHCRRPHIDDLSRLEQTLRDLEVGAFRALSSFNRLMNVYPDRRDPVVDAWFVGEHEVAKRLLEHARRQYETAFELSWSRRPWSEAISANVPITGTRGYVWHAELYFHDRTPRLRDFWNDDYLGHHRESILLLCANSPSSFSISFAALENPSVIADVIGICFDVALTNMRGRHREVEDDWRRWAKQNADLDPRVQAGGMWAMVSDSTKPIALFAA